MTMGDNYDKGYLEIKERLDGINGNSLDAKVQIDWSMNSTSWLLYYNRALSLGQ